MNKSRFIAVLSGVLLLQFLPTSGWAATSIPFTITMNEAVTVNTGGGTPRIAVNVGGVTRYASYGAGTGTSTLTFTYSAQAGDLDLDGVTLSSPLDLNGGTITDLNGNPETDLTFSVPNTSGIKVDYPSLSMDFTIDSDGQYTLNGTTYNSLSAFLTATSGTFTRSSIGTYFDSTGTLQTASSDQPRFDYDPVTHAAKGFLIEELRTNLISRSEELDLWGKVTSTVTANSTTAPDGNLSADLLTANTVTVNNGLVSNSVTGSFATYTSSVYVKAGNSSHVRIQPHSNIDSTSTGFVASFDLATQTATISSTYGGKFTNMSATITPVGGGWYRLTTTYTVTGTVYNSALVIWLYPYQTGDSAGSNVYFWGNQLEVGSFATSYIPTISSAVTRQKDVTTIPISGWFNPAEGGAFASWTKFANPNTVIFELKDASAPTSDRFNVFSGARKTRLQIFPQGIAVIDSSGTYVPFVANNTVKAALAYKSGDSAVTADGVAPLTSSASFSPVSNYTELNLGRTDNNIYGNPISSGAVNGHLQNFKYYPARIANTQLQLLTQ